MTIETRFLLNPNNQLCMLTEDMTSEQRRENYLCDITYVTNSELGFDYLRDNLATESTLCSMQIDLPSVLLFLTVYSIQFNFHH